MVDQLENTMKSWESLTELEQTACIYWDMYKSAHGIRPRHVDTSAWTMAEYEQEFQNLEQVIARNEQIRLEDEARACHDFEIRVQSLMSSGARTREMAIQWIHQAEDSDGDDEYLCFLVGLPYGYFRQAA
jgi:hypothetical protein